MAVILICGHTMPPLSKVRYYNDHLPIVDLFFEGKRVGYAVVEYEEIAYNKVLQFISNDTEKVYLKDLEHFRMEDICPESKFTLWKETYKPIPNPTVYKTFYDINDVENLNSRLVWSFVEYKDGSCAIVSGIVNSEDNELIDKISGYFICETPRTNDTQIEFLYMDEKVTIANISDGLDGFTISLENNGSKIATYPSYDDAFRHCAINNWYVR